MSQDPIEYLVNRSPEGLDISSLSKIFQDTTNCYKVLFFKAILDLSQLQSKQAVVISLNDIADSMVYHVWYPIRYFRLSLGAQDSLARIVDDLSMQLPLDSIKLNNHQLKHHIAESMSSKQRDELLRYVPFRLLTPFFSDRLKGLPDHQKNLEIAELSCNLMCSENPPVYAVYREKRELVIHPKWVAFFNENYLILDGWCNFHWAKFLQSRNPSVPSVINKLVKPQSRASLNLQREIWRTFLSRQAIKCVYSTTPIKSDSFSLDHIIPWSFVCHDFLWNLIPTTRSINSAKGALLPSKSEIQQITEIQFEFLQDTHCNQPKRQKTRVFEDFMQELKLNEDELLNWHIFKSHYESTMGALSEVARHNGF